MLFKEAEGQEEIIQWAVESLKRTQTLSKTSLNFTSIVLEEQNGYEEGM